MMRRAARFAARQLPAAVKSELADLGYAFETTEGRGLSRRRVEHSLEAILRIVARPSVH
jgi:hypothetical protein